MLNLKLTDKSKTNAIGLLIFFVPFFTFLSAENLKILGKGDIFEVFLSLIIILIVIFISSFSFEMLIKRLFKKKIILFPLLCFVFYLNFSFIPVIEYISDLLYPIFGYVYKSLLFIFFELVCLGIIVFGAKFKLFSIRMIFIFSVLMLINTIIPLVSYLVENIGKKSTTTYEIEINESASLAQNNDLTKHNVYYIILDAMQDIDTVSKANIVPKKKTLDNLSSVGLKYIDKSQSTYSVTHMTLASIMLADYHQKPSSPDYLDGSHFYPGILQQNNNKVPLISYLNKASSSFIWSGNSYASCSPSLKWTCINSRHDLPSKNFFKFYLSTPFTMIYLKIFKDAEGSKSIDKFLKHVDTNGIPKTPFFAFIHHLSPHAPFLDPIECEVIDYPVERGAAYKSSYNCALRIINTFMEKINHIDPEAIVIFQGDHGWNGWDKSIGDKEISIGDKEILRGRIFNAIKAPEICFEQYGLPKTNVNTTRFALNCAYGFQFPYLRDTHYNVPDEKASYGKVIEKIIYE